MNIVVNFESGICFVNYLIMHTFLMSYLFADRYTHVFQHQTCSRDCELPFLLKFSEHKILFKSVMTDTTRITYLRRYFSVTLVSVNNCLPTWNWFEIYSESTMTMIQ